MPAFAASSTVQSVVRADTRTGKLIRTISAPRQPPQEISGLIDRIAEEHGVEVPLVHSVIQAESNYSPTAVSPKGAQGIMQLMPATARRFGVSDIFDPRENIQGGVKYLRFLLDYYQGDYSKTIAAYNAGEGTVDRYHGVPPYAETRSYVDHVALNLKAAREKATPAKPVLSEIETARAIEASVGSDGRVYYRTP